MDSNLLAKNTVLNLLGNIIPLIVAVIAIPHVIHGLGKERFGVLSLVWVLIGYAAVFDLGLGRATTKFVADALGKKKADQIPSIVWSSLLFQTALGLAAGCALVLVTPLLVGRVLRISPSMIQETKVTFYLISLLIPIVMYTGSLRGILEAGQRFDLINAAKIPVNSLVFLIPLLALLMHLRLPGIILLLLAVWVINALVYFWFSVRLFPKLMEKFAVDLRIYRTLLTYGGWITLCNMLVPVLVYADRFLIGSLVSVAALTYYSTSYEMTSRLLIIPASFSSTLFPAFSTLHASQQERLGSLFTRSIKYLLLSMGPVVFIVFTFSSDILRVWLGSSFAAKGAAIFQILSLGMLLNGLATISAYLLDGIGRPDIRAKLHLSYILFYFGLAWYLISRFSLVGAALAWTIRAAVELVLFTGVSWKVMHLKFSVLVENGFLRIAPAFIALIGMLYYINLLLGKELLSKAVATAVFLVIFAVSLWLFVLNEEDKGFLMKIVRR